MFSFQSNQPSSQISPQIIQYFKQYLPIPTYNLKSQFHTLPYTLQTQQNFHSLQKLNSQSISQKFNKILTISFNQFPKNPSNISNIQIVQGIVNNLRNESLKDYSFNDYVSCIQSYGSKLASQNNLPNQQFTNKILSNLLQNYSNYYQGAKPSQEYYKILNQVINQKFNGKANSQNQYKKQQKISYSNLHQNKNNSQQQLKKTVQVDQHAQFLQNLLISSQNQTNNYNNYSKPTQQVNYNNKKNIAQNENTNTTNLHKSSQIVNDKLSLISRLFVSQSNQKQIEQKFNQSQFKMLTFYQFHMLNHLFNTITMNHCKMIQRYPYIQNANDSLNYALSNLKQNRNQHFLFLQQNLCKQMNFALSFFQNNQGGQKGIYYGMQSWMIVMIHIYKCLADNYDPYRRRFLKIIYTFFCNQKIQNTVQCLRWLQNNRSQVLALQPIQDFISKSRSIIFQIYNNRANFLKDKTFNDVPNFLLLSLSQPNLPRRKVVNIWVAGFLSQDMDKTQHWKALTAFMPESQIYAVQWTSDKISGLVKFIGKSCFDLLTADKMKDQLKKKFADNPFIPAMKTSINLGRYLAQMLIKLFPNQFINIVGYSLGSQLIKSCMERLIQIKKQNILNNIYMLGGVTDTKQMQVILQNANYPWCLYNLYTENDMVLKHILSMCLPNGNPIGINKIKQIKGHQIINVDCSDFISGHLSYMSNFGVVGKVVQMNKQ